MTCHASQLWSGQRPTAGSGCPWPGHPESRGSLV